MQILTELHYLPSIPYFSNLLKADKIIIEAKENFQKQSYRNRCYILAAQGIQSLSIPVEKSFNKNIRDVKIDYAQRWQQIHLRTMKAAYGKSAYFEHYYESFEKIILSKNQFLFDTNFELMSKCLCFLKIKLEMAFTENFEKELNSQVIDSRNQFSLEYTIPTDSAVVSKKYYQLFGNVFVNHLSIIDLLFNEGTNAKRYLYHRG